MGLQTLAGATFATALLGAGTVVSANVLTVQQGDTLSEIAQKHHTTVAKLAKDNHIKNVDFITAGQKLNIDDNLNHAVTRKATDTDTHYTVVSGDTLSTIAEAYGTSAHAIAELNDMSVSDTLHIGQLLTVSGTTATAKPVEPVAPSAVAEPASTATSDVQAPSSVAPSAVAEPESTATSTVSEPVSVASSALAEPVSVASPVTHASSSVAPSAVSESVSTATSSVQESSSIATPDSQALETVASSAIAEPEPTATSTVSEPESAVSSVVAEPESTATVSEPETVASSAIAEPETVATSDVQTPSSVASSAVPEPVSTATSDAQTPTAPEQTVSTPIETPVANTTSGALGAGTLTSAQKNAIVNEALSLSTQNIPYVWGGKTTAGFDCSGLASYVFAQAGLSLPSYTVSEEAYVNTMDVSSVSDVTANAQPGDLLFWGDHGSTWHVAIYIGGGQYVAAPQPGMNVEVENVSPYFMPSFIGRY